MRAEASSGTRGRALTEKLFLKLKGCTAAGLALPQLNPCFCLDKYLLPLFIGRELELDEL